MATGNNIRIYRKQLGMTLAELSDASGVDLATISALEQRDSRSSRHFGPIARAFGLSLEQLSAESGSVPTKPTKANQTTDLPHGLSREALALAKLFDKLGRNDVVLWARVYQQLTQTIQDALTPIPSTPLHHSDIQSTPESRPALPALKQSPSKK